MYYDPNFNRYLHQLQDTIQTQHIRMEQMEKLISNLQQELVGLKKEPRLAVDRIEYKFDQLKIERLDGTLNIGLTPKSGEQLLEDLSVNGQDTDPEPDLEMPDAPNVMNHILKELDQYLKTELLNDLKIIEGRLQFPLNDSYRQFIIEDIRKQINQRVSDYLKQYTQKQILEEPTDIERHVYEKVKRDILKGIESFINRLKQSGETT